MDHAKEFKTVQHKVEFILEIYEEARNSDYWLLIRYLQTFHKELNLFVKYAELKSVPAFETITRCRRKVQNEEHKFKAKQEVQQMRIDKQNAYNYVSTW